MSFENWVLTTDALEIELGERAWRWLEDIYIDGWTPMLDLQLSALAEAEARSYLVISRDGS